MSKFFDTKKFIEEKMDELDRTRKGIDIGKVTRFEFAVEKKYVARDCYLLLDGKKLLLWTGIKTWIQLDLDSISYMQAVPNELLKYGKDSFYQIKKSARFPNTTDDILSISFDQHEKIQIITDKIKKVRKAKELIKKEKEKQKLEKELEKEIEKQKQIIELEKEELERIKALKQEELMQKARKERQIRIKEKQERFLLTIENAAADLYKSDRNYQLLYNLMDKHVSAFYLNIENFKKHEDYLLNKSIGIGENPYLNDFNIPTEFKNILNMFLRLLMKNNDLHLKEDNLGLLIILKALRKIALDYFTSKFTESYAGYFTDVEKMNFKNCILAYCSIDLINPQEKSNITMFTYFLISKNKLSVKPTYDLLVNGYNKTLTAIIKALEEKELNLFEMELLGKDESFYDRRLSIHDIDLMNGFEFEQFLSDLFKKMDYSTQQTKASGDQGVDLIAVKHGKRIGIQAKCYNSNVSNKAIQEVVAGIKHYNIPKGIVITNSQFTKSAIELAHSNDILLWDRSVLIEKIAELY